MHGDAHADEHRHPDADGIPDGDAYVLGTDPVHADADADMQPICAAWLCDRHTIANPNL
jgi:hypothetical protein